MARKVLIATHGHLASGFKSAVQILLGSSYEPETICAYTEEEPGDYSGRIKAFLDSVGPDDEGVIFTDLAGGSVNQKVMQVNQPPHPNVYVITESNLMTIIAILLEGSPLTAEGIEALISQSSPMLAKFEVVAGSENSAEDADAFLS